jgi:integrase/recombinase XerD
MVTDSQKQALTLSLYSLARWADGFFTAKRAEGLALRTQAIYRKNVSAFVDWCEAQNVHEVDHIDPDLIRQWLLALEEHGHNPGGIHQFYRCVKTFFLWYELECAPDGWRNPIKRVKAPKLPEEILEPVALADVALMMETCKHGRESLRDKAVLLTLLDTGARASELCAFNVEDLDPVTGTLTIRHGKGGKGRIVFAGVKTRRCIRAYLKDRGRINGDAPLFVNHSGRRLTYCALRGIVERRAEAAGLPEPGLHGFRRAFALNMLRSGVDIITLQRLLGHADLSVIKRYLKQNTEDLRVAHAAHSPVDQAEW